MDNGSWYGPFLAVDRKAAEPGVEIISQLVFAEESCRALPFINALGEDDRRGTAEYTEGLWSFRTR